MLQQAKISLWHHRLTLLLIFVVFGGLHLFIVSYNHYMFRTFTFDYGVYSYALYDYSHFRISICPMYKLWGVERTFLQDHFSLSFFVLIPFFWLLNPFFGTYTVFIIQWGFILYGAWMTYKLVELKSEKKWVAIIGLLYYFVMYGRYSSYQNDCNLTVIGAAVLPAFIYYFEKQNFWLTFAAFAFLVINREDFSLCLVFMCGAFAMVHWRDKKMRAQALYLSLVALVCFIIIYEVLIPALHDEKNDYRLFDYSVLGRTPFAALQFIIQHPIRSFQYLFINHTNDASLDGIKEKFYLVYGVSGGFLLLLRPAYLFLLIPFLAKKMYNDSADRWSCETYYSVEEASILPALVFMTISQLKFNWLRNILYPLVCVAAAYTTWYCMFAAYYPNTYLKFNVFNNNYYKQDFDISPLHDALKDIPPDVPVSASTRILPHLANRRYAHHFPTVENAEYVCVHTQIDTYPYTPDDYKRETQKLLDTGDWKIMKENSQILVLKKTKY